MFNRIFIIALLSIACFSFAQEDTEILQEKEKIKAAIAEETNAWRDNDYKKWADAWGQDEYIFWVNSGVDFYYEYDSWKELNKTFKQIFKNRKKPREIKIRQDNFNIRIFGNGAFATYDQHRSWESKGQQRSATSKDFRALEKVNGEWKITFMGDILKSQYTDTTWTNVERYINTLGYMILNGNRPKEAAKLLKLNTEFFPNSANVWDSLGEAYMAAGENELAIKNYKKSLELNPKSKTAKKMLKKLKSK